MDKFAQERGILNKIREKINQPIAEGFFKPELARIMNDLKVADDNIRSVLVGQKVGKPSADFTPGRSIKDLLKSAHSNFNRREYMSGVADLGEFHKRLFDATKLIDKLDLSVNKIHHNFLFQSLSPKQRENIKGLQEYMKAASDAANEPYFIKEAGIGGIMDFFHNVGTRRGWALAAWEKKYPKVVKDLRDGGTRLVDAADTALANTLAHLKDMATARAIRQVDDYMDAAKKIKAEYAKFDGGDKGFRAYYTNVITPYLKKQEEFEKEEAAKKPAPDAATPAPTVSTTPSASTTTAPTAPMGAGFVGVAPSPWGSSAPPGASPPFAPHQEEVIEVSPDDPDVKLISPPPGEKTQPSPPPVHTAHARFYNSLEAMGNEDPRILASYIAKYAAHIQKDDPEAAIKLFSLSKQIKG